MAIPKVEGLDKLYQAISEALEIEKCSICLERLENTVLLWPCTHWFCNNCISTLHKSARGEKVTCPLCKSTTSRRKILSFQDKQKEYEDHLQTLIGALSLDLKFDVTSYNNLRKHENRTNDEIVEINKPAVELSSLKKTRTRAALRVVKVKEKPDIQQNQKRASRKSGNQEPKSKKLITAKSNKPQVIESPKPVPAMLPETPDDSPKQRKVREWLDSTKFSQADEVCVETVVADVHNAEQDESLCFSETALQSVSQVDYRSVKTPSDIDATKATKRSSENLSSKIQKFKNQKAVTVPAVEKFDEIFPENRKLQTVKTTYGSKNPYTSTRTRGQRFAVQADLFKSIDEDKGKNENSSLEDTSEGTLEDFSSGSGEEWTIEKKQKKYNLMGKGKVLKNNIKSTIQRKRKNSIENYVSAVPVRDNLRNSDKQDLKTQKINKNELQNVSNLKRRSNNTLDKCDAVEEFCKPKEDAVKDIIDDWNDTKDSNNLLKSQAQNIQIKDVTVTVESKTYFKSINAEFQNHNMSANITNQVVNTPSKEVNTRSPGWSRLKSTKKEFHLSEKKKLSLKTLNKSNSSITSIGILPLLDKSNPEQPTLQSSEDVKSISVNKLVNSPKNVINDQSSKPPDASDHCKMRNQKTPEFKGNLNTSHTSSASGSPFRGFTTPEEKESFTKLISHVNKTKENPGNSVASDCTKKVKDNCNSIMKKDLAVHPPDNVSNEDSMEVDFIPCSIIPENLLATSQKPKEMYNSSETDVVNKPNFFQEESKGCLSNSKKRDRDSGIHNESGISSPIRKRVCRDVEVQTSPSRMQSVIRDMLKDMSLMELEEFIKQSKTDSSKYVNTVHVLSPHTVSQDSDKENIDVSSKNQNASKIFDDSDIVLGTEDCIALAHINPQVGIFHTNNMRTQEPLGHHVYREKRTDFKEADPDALTQLYKTPKIPKRPLQTSTKEYTVVSNPTSSELKRADSLFDNSDVIFPDETPKGITLLNYSGVNQLEENVGTIKKSVNETAILPHSQSLKEKSNRSRRQLDFVEENSNDIFEFERETIAKSKELVENYETNNPIHNKEEKFDEVDNFFMQSNEQLHEIIGSSSKGKESLSEKNMNLRSEPQEVNLGSETLSDTPGIVGPSEVQCFDERVPLNAPNRRTDKVDTNKNKTVDKLVICSSSTNIETERAMNQIGLSHEITNEMIKGQSELYQGSPLMFKESSSEKKVISTNYENTRDDDEASIPSSDISVVEGTPDVSQDKENLDIFNFGSKNEEEDARQEKIADTSVEQSVREKVKPATSSCDPLNGDESGQKDGQKCIIDDDELIGNQMSENTETDDNLCFASSLLNPQQNQVLTCVLGGMELPYSKTVGPHISHLIVGTKNGCFQNTYKVLHAMALHKPIIRFDWVEEVIRTGGTVPLDPFVALDPSGECGVVRAKADKHRKLLQDFAIHIYNVNDRIVLKEQIEELVRLCGGTVVKELQDFSNVPREKFRIIVLSEPPDSLTQGEWRQKYMAAEVMIDWIYNTIGRYRVVPLVPFMVTDTVDAAMFLQHEGYPKELIFDLSTQE